MPQLHAVIHGYVQGVSFRYHTQIQAQSLGLKGWVRNMLDGTVETVAVGDQNALDTFLQWLHHGPAAARVAQVDAEWSDTNPRFSGFEIRHGSE
jgi:acylphosphatase